MIQELNTAWALLQQVEEILGREKGQTCRSLKSKFYVENQAMFEDLGF